LISAPEFAKNIDTNNLINVLKKHFDQVMTLYNIIGRRDDIDVLVLDDKGDKIQFGLLLETQEDASKLYNLLNGTVINAYDCKFALQMMMRKNRITVSFNKV